MSSIKNASYFMAALAIYLPQNKNIRRCF